MKCLYCGSELPANVNVCPFCEAPLNKPNSDSNDIKTNSILFRPNEVGKNGTKIEGTQPTITDIDISKSKELAAKIAGLGMRWYKIVLILLILFLIVNLAYSVCLFTGFIYLYEIGENAIVPGFIQTFYQMYPLMKFIDVLCGILEIAAAVFFGITYYMMKGYKRNSLKFLLLSYVLSESMDRMREIMKLICLGLFNGTKLLELLAGLLVPAAFLVINYVYFKKRAFLFDQ